MIKWKKPYVMKPSIVVWPENDAAIFVAGWDGVQLGLTNGGAGIGVMVGKD
jgi:hypothetical protein